MHDKILYHQRVYKISKHTYLYFLLGMTKKKTGNADDITYNRIFGIYNCSRQNKWLF